MTGKHQSVLRRYFDSRIATQEQLRVLSPEENFYVHQHHNSLCIVTLGPSHPIIAQNLTIDRVDFDVGNSDRSKNVVRGKKKKGGLRVEPKTVLCHVYTKNEIEGAPPLKVVKTDTEGDANTTKWIIYGCIAGSLIQPNLRLKEDTQLLQKKPFTDGFFAIIMPYRASAKTVLHKLVTEEEFAKLKIEASQPIPVEEPTTNTKEDTVMKQEEPSQPISTPEATSDNKNDVVMNQETWLTISTQEETITNDKKEDIVMKQEEATKDGSKEDIVMKQE